MATNKDTTNILGKEVDKPKYYLILFSYVIFITFILPLIIGGYVIVSGIVCFIPAAISSPFYELFNSIKFYRKVLYTFTIISTFIYTFFFLDGNFTTNMLHYIFNLFFAYLISRDNLFQWNKN